MHWLGMHLYSAATDNTEYHKRLQAALTLSATGLTQEAQMLAKLANQKGTAISLWAAKFHLILTARFASL